VTTLAGRAGRVVRPALPPLVARGVAFAALCGFGLLHWMVMTDPAEPGRAAAGLGVALAACAAARLWPPALGAVLLAALIAGGVAPADLWPTHWGHLATSIGDGVGSVGAARIPYTGTDADLRLVIPLGGVLLAAVAGILAFRGHRMWALCALVTLYAVPAIALDLQAEFLRGAVLAVLVILFLRLERTSQRELAAAAGLAAAAAVAALAAAPALDTRRPWFDYEEFAQQTASARAVTFSWDHDYAALPWPRDGREMLRVESPRRAYWKVDGLDLFDGERWAEDPTRGAPAPLEAQNHAVTPENLARWTFPVAVSIRGLRSPTLALAGMPQSVAMSDREPFPVASGIWTAGRGIHRADSYRARVYVPSPTRAELETAVPTFYPDAVLQDLTFEANTGPVGESIEVFVRQFKQRPFLVSYGPQSAVRDLRASNVRRIYALSRRLLRDAATPYEYLQAVQRHLQGGFGYDETPPPAARTLDGFLFDAKSGFCQQYSGAMALLLRMGGVPARVATGFAPGSYDEDAKVYVVRDLDAHSWVEAWFEGIGWVDFDPTPPSAPPRSQALAAAVSASEGDIRDRGTTQIADAPFKSPDSPWDEVALTALGFVAAGALVGAVALRRRRERIVLSELERALRSAGETCGPGTTLTALEARLPAAAEYLRALRAERYAGGTGPTAAHRRVLRRALTHGRGPLARGRTWLALRPRLRS
jgi:transglutaminase-like putative cysteine protease